MVVSCIYKISNLVNGDFYIGSAKSFIKRKNKHLHELRKVIHPNIHLQRSFSKYGEENFVFIILEETINLIEREQYYIDTLLPQYNICKVAGNSTGRKATEETKAKMRLTHSKRDCKHTEETKIKMRLSGRPTPRETILKSAKNNSIPINKLNLSGEILETFSSIISAEKATGISAKNIGMVLKKRKYRNTAGGFKWQYKEKIS